MFDRLWKKVVAVSALIVAVTGFLSAVVTIAGWFKVEPATLLGLRSALGGVLFLFESVWHWLWSDHAVSGWLIVIMSLASAAAAARLIYLLKPQLVPTQEAQPAFRKYIQDRIFDVVCRWRWNSYNEPDDVRYFCPTCEGELGYTNQAAFIAVPRTGLGCYKCKKVLAEFDGDYDFVDERILSEIDRRARVDHGKPSH